MDYDFLFMVLCTSIFDNMWMLLLALVIVCKASVALYHKYVLEDDKWYIATIPFSEHYLRWRTYCVTHIALSIFAFLFQVAFLFIHTISFFVLYCVLNGISLYKESQALGLGKPLCYAIIPCYKFVVMGKEALDVRAETRGNIRGGFRAEPGAGTESGTGTS